ncbi:hypothetical protein [Mesobacillus subterraneus]|uniref:Uncharacterized protein n=1 Tax=Mesobacillus subterraneus TaxID=285983 RepID=A0A3R9KUF9_9BACI|nr:hypothetical protein [Mesobacillus subterraneus]RSD26470.1 hypothetical protein EJA10_13775 [Mesobacillus subterraneus]
MLWKVFRLFFGLLCGYLVVNWLPDFKPRHEEEFVSDFILHPIEFFAGAMALVFGMYAIGGLLREGLGSFMNIFKGKRVVVSDIILAIGCFGCFSLLIQYGFWQTSVFFGFCLLYGMISFSPYKMEKDHGK